MRRVRSWRERGGGSADRPSRTRQERCAHFRSQSRSRRPGSRLRRLHAKIRYWVRSTGATYRLRVRRVSLRPFNHRSLDAEKASLYAHRIDAPHLFEYSVNT
jgi:hypothetical protein